MQSIINVISRKSPLALKQVEEVFSFLPELKYNVIPIISYGDRHKEISLMNNREPDFFTRELDDALLRYDAEIAIHSAKDMPYPLRHGLEVIALLQATDKTDSLVSRDKIPLNELPKGAKIGTSSLTRKNELIKIRADLEIVNIRGTIEERLDLVEKGVIDALIVATCALKRLGLENIITETLPFETHPLQGHLAVVARMGNVEMKKIFESVDIRKQYGAVHLVGFGPGSPDLLTIRAFNLLVKANVIFYDDLLDKTYLNNLKAERVYVGKRRGLHFAEQDKINKLLYDEAIQGKTVVRLKGGDPMLFAHGGEEIEYLQQYLVPVKVVPGISAAHAAAAYTHIPLTHRELSSSVTFLSGQSLQYTDIPLTGTVVVYMGAVNIKLIVRKAIKAGRPSNTPVALVYNVSLADQEEEITTLNDILQVEITYKTPLIIIIGEVVNLRNQKAAEIAKPNILVTGTDASEFHPFGNVIHQPLISLSSTSMDNSFIQFMDNPDAFDWIIFTSRHAVKFFFEALFQSGKDVRKLGSLKVASIGKTTSIELRKFGLKPDLQPKDESSDGLVKLFNETEKPGQKIFIPRSNLSLALLPEGLAKTGNYVLAAILYENQMPDDVKPLDLSDIHVVSFSSPSGIDNFLTVYKEFSKNVRFIVKGEVTRLHLISKGIAERKISTLEEWIDQSKREPNKNIAKEVIEYYI